MSETTEFKVDLNSTLKSVQSEIISSNSSESDIESARKLINETIESVSSNNIDKTKTVEIVQELYTILMETGIPGNLYSSLYRWLTTAKG